MTELEQAFADWCAARGTTEAEEKAAREKYEQILASQAFQEAPSKKSKAQADLTSADPA